MTPLPKSLQRGSEELIPGIFDDLILAQIVPRLSWKDFYGLSRVSPAWLHAIRTRQVYDARVASHSTQTMVVWGFTLPGPFRTIHCLSSRREDPFQPQGSMFQPLPACPKLPPSPYFGGEFVCSDGYIYHLGAVESPHSQLCCNKVFVFDVAGGQREWKECASMNEQRREFGCAAMHGKLYVFGGLSKHKTRSNFVRATFCGSEMYDPKEDRWYVIKPMKILRYGHNVHIVGDELFVHGGFGFDPNHFKATEVKVDNNSSDDEDDRGDDVNSGDEGQSSSDNEDDSVEDDNLGNEIDYCWQEHIARSLEVYHPVKDAWRMVNPFGRAAGYMSVADPGSPSSLENLFAVDGKLYSIDCSNIYAYVGENSWTHLHSFSFPGFSYGSDRFVNTISSVVVIDGELLVEADWWNTDNNYRSAEVFESEGFCGESKEIIWQVTRFRPQLDFSRSRPQSSKLNIQL